LKVKSYRTISRYSDDDSIDELDYSKSLIPNANQAKPEGSYRDLGKGPEAILVESSITPDAEPKKSNTAESMKKIDKTDAPKKKKTKKPPKSKTNLDQKGSSPPKKKSLSPKKKPASPSTNNEPSPSTKRKASPSKTPEPPKPKKTATTKKAPSSRSIPKTSPEKKLTKPKKTSIDPASKTAAKKKPIAKKKAPKSANPIAPEPLQANFETLGCQEEGQSQFDQQISQSEGDLREIFKVGELGVNEKVRLASLEDELLQESKAEPEILKGLDEKMVSENNSGMNSARLSQRLDEELMQRGRRGDEGVGEREDEGGDLLEEHYGPDGEISGDQGQ
jgi:hypothetical protein